MFNFLKNFLSLGFSKNGLSHWFWQRITAIIMTFLLIWTIVSFESSIIYFEENFSSWLKVPFNSILFIFLFIMIIHHSTLGILNIFEDYIDELNKKILLKKFIKLLSFFLIVVSCISILNIHF